MQEYHLTDSTTVRELSSIVDHADPVEVEIIAMTSTVLYALPHGYDRVVFVPAVDELASVRTGDSLRLVPAVEPASTDVPVDTPGEPLSARADDERPSRRRIRDVTAAR